MKPQWNVFDDLVSLIAIDDKFSITPSEVSQLLIYCQSSWNISFDFCAYQILYDLCQILVIFRYIVKELSRELVVSRFFNIKNNVLKPLDNQTFTLCNHYMLHHVPMASVVEHHDFSTFCFVITVALTRMGLDEIPWPFKSLALLARTVHTIFEHYVPDCLSSAITMKAFNHGPDHRF